VNSLSFGANSQHGIIEDAGADPRPVSTVITTYNHARFLAEAIESALGQTVVPAEVIVFDDGSTDDPDAVVRRYPGVRLIRQSNHGLAAARNTGWRAACGHYVVFLDADDRLMPEALAVNLQRFDEKPHAPSSTAAFTISMPGAGFGLLPTPDFLLKMRTNPSSRPTWSACTRGSCTGAIV